MIHAEASDFLEEPQHLFALTPAVDHHRYGTEVHSVGRHKQQVARHSVELRQQHANPDGSLGNIAVDSEQFFCGHCEHKLVVERA